MSKNDGGPAFPAAAHVDPRQPSTLLCGASQGMSLRDWFAGQALIGLLANANLNGGLWAIAARDAYNAADAMIAARKQP